MNDYKEPETICTMSPRNSGIDHCIKTIVDALNSQDNETVASCCGHGYQPQRIDLKDGRTILILSFDQAHDVAVLFPGINGEWTPQKQRFREIVKENDRLTEWYMNHTSSKAQAARNLEGCIQHDKGVLSGLRAGFKLGLTEDHDALSRIEESIRKEIKDAKKEIKAG